MSKIGEFELIGRINASVTVPQGVTGIGDDCAIIPQKQGLDTLVTTDLLIEGRHFLLSDVTPFRLGWKSAAVNISDIAAMGGRPTSAFLSIAMPKGLSDKRIAVMDEGPGHPDGEELWIDGFIRGFNACCSRFGVSLLGGDTSASPSQLFINVTVMGECLHDAAIRRDGALPGDAVCVTGPLGDSGTGLRLILERTSGSGGGGSTGNSSGNSPEEYLIGRHYLPEPRVDIGLTLAATPGVHSMMDISDGIASDLRHILDASSRRSAPTSLGAEIDLRSLPISARMQAVCNARGWDAAEIAVSGGEDYELLFTAAPGTPLPDGCTVIGRIVQGGGGIRWIGSDKEFKGFTHF